MNTIRRKNRTGRLAAGLLSIALATQSCVIGHDSWVVRTIEATGTAAVIAAPLTGPGNGSLEIHEWHN